MFLLTINQRYINVVVSITNRGIIMVKKLVSQPITKETNDKLIAISKSRKASGALIKSKQDILTVLVDGLYKKEIK